MRNLQNRFKIEEFNLSEKIDEEVGVEEEFILISDVKEFIRLLKEEFVIEHKKTIEKTVEIAIRDFTKLLDKLAGEKLR